MKCKNCGQINSEQVNFCTNCGSKIEQEIQEKVKNVYIPDAKDTIYCEHCGKAISKDAYLCPGCGYLTEHGRTSKTVSDVDVPNIGLNIVAFLFPIIGLVLWATTQGKTPKRAKQIGIWTLIGFILGIVFRTFRFLF